ncbi:MAG: hypothetical protein JJ974_11365 [Phycisphaerales bacterium]|nr:hypothetical protein [Phycisphaerales bacterium]
MIPWPFTGMYAQLKTRFIRSSAIIASALLFSSMLGGCTSSHPSAAWQGSGMYVGNSTKSSALVFAPTREGTGTLSYIDTNAPEFSRNDHTLSQRDLSRRDELFGIPAERHPSLDYWRTFRTSRNAEVYTYPSRDRGYRRGYRRSYRHHGR